MWHVTFSGTTAGTAIILTMALPPALRAQDPRTQSQTSAVQRLTHDSTTRQTVSGRMRELRCRGKPGIDIRVYQESSPRTPKLVTMVLRYDRPKETRTLGQVGMGTVDYGASLQLIPGSCTWRYDGAKDIPFEPGVVYFDIDRDAQGWTSSAARDTTIDVAMNFPDVVSLPRYQRFHAVLGVLRGRRDQRVHQLRPARTSGATDRLRRWAARYGSAIHDPLGRAGAR